MCACMCMYVAWSVCVCVCVCVCALLCVRERIYDVSYSKSSLFI